MTDAPARRPLHVLQSFRAPRRTTNPYLVQLLGSLPEDVVPHTFSWREALLGGYDVLHVHWPEVVLRGSSRLRTAARAVLFSLLLLRTVLRRTAVVRTLHNVDPHEAGGRVERLLLRALDRRTTVWLRLNPTTAPPAAAPSGRPVVTVLHGHYRDWFASHHAPGSPGAVPGRLLLFGLLRPYKGVEELLAAFHTLPDDQVSLRVVGRPSTTELAEQIARACAADPRVSSVLDYVDDDVLAAEVAAASVVVLPYRRMHNSGAALLALSLDRPVLVTESETSRLLAAEVGEGWVRRFTGTLTAEDLELALAAAPRVLGGQPDLSAREWADIGRDHAEAYRRALRLTRGGRP